MSFFYTILGITQSNSVVLVAFEGFVQLIPKTYKSEEPIIITGVDKTQLKCDCINGSVVNGVREPTLYSFALDQPPCHKIHIELQTKLFEKINRPILSHITFCLEDDYHKPGDFNEETISFTCQLIEI